MKYFSCGREMFCKLASLHARPMGGKESRTFSVLKYLEDEAFMFATVGYFISSLVKEVD